MCGGPFSNMMLYQNSESLQPNRWYHINCFINYVFFSFKPLTPTSIHPSLTPASSCNVNNIVRLQTLLCHFSSRCSSVLSCKTRTKQLSGRRMWRDNHWLVHWLVDNIKWHCDVMLWAGDVRLGYFYHLVLFCNELLFRLLVAGISISMDGTPVHCCVLSGCH